MAKPHKLVHENIKKAIECVAQNTCAENSKNIMTYFKDAEKSSREVIFVLDSVLKEEKAIRYKK